MGKRGSRPKSTGKAPGGSVWPAYTVERWKIGRLTAYARNARNWTMPVLARADGTIIAGHGRVEAAIAEGYKEVPVIVATGWTLEQCRVYGLADNKLSDSSEWDNEALDLELSELNEAEINLAEFDFGDESSAESATERRSQTQRAVIFRRSALQRRDASGRAVQ
jgi:ParB-like chromosome segregation protein Spo0J